MKYVIPDEPHAGRFGHLVVRPSGPLLAAMLCGAWLAWPWFAFNAFAFGSPTRRKELMLCGAAIGGTVVLAVVALLLIDHGVIDSKAKAQLAGLAISTWKLTMAYWTYTIQSRTFHVYEHYRGPIRRAAPLLIAGFWLRPILLGLIDDPLWVIIIAWGV